MTEQQWLASTDPRPMLEFLRGRASNRKLRLFACACHRRVRHVPGDDDELPRAVDNLERYADGPVGGWGPGAIEQAEEAMIGPGDRGWRSTPWVEHASSYAAGLVTLPEFQRLDAAEAAAFPGRSSDPAAARTTRDLAEAAYRRAVAAERGEQGRLLRDIFGPLPFRPVTPDPAWQTALGVALTQAAYDERELPAGTLDLARLAVLADALEEAGCTDADILNHCRQPGVHVRGCWVVDLLLGKS
jgi:hypothetical protein